MASQLSADSENYQTTTLLEKLDEPWSIAFPNEDTLLISLRTAKLLSYNINDKSLTELSGLPDIAVRGQGGLLGLAVDPDFANNRKIYFCFSAKQNGDSGSEVRSAIIENNSLINQKTLFVASPKTGGSNHFGCRLAVKNNLLFISLGDKFGHKDKAQLLDNHLGKIIRIHTDGSVPEDNPFVKSSFPEIWSFGHRNVQGLGFDAEGRLWANEHGPRGGDELNIIEPAKNYGWPKITYGRNYSGTKVSDHTALPGMEQPIIHWTPSIAPSGMSFYYGEKYPELNNKLLVAVLKHQHLRVITIEDDKVISQQKLLEDLDERIRDVKQGPDGYIYFVSDSSKGKLFRLEPKD